MTRVVLPDVMRRASGLETTEFDVTGEDVQTLLCAICEEHGELRDHLFAANGELKDHFVVSVDGALAEPSSKTESHSTVELMLSASGGSADTFQFSPDEIRRYARHLTLPAVGRRGQSALRRASVLIIGAGGLGSPASLYLAAAGVGRIGLVDFDDVELSNLQRQVIHGTQSEGQAKVLSAQRRLADLNPHVRVDAHQVAVSVDNAVELMRGYDIVVDGSDNFETRYLVNAASRLLGKPLVFAAIQQFDGQVSVFNVGDDAPCYQCVFRTSPPPELAPNCAAGGVLGVLPGVIGTVQANETLKLILGLGEPLVGKFWRLNALDMAVSTVCFSKRADCPTCNDPAAALTAGTRAGACEAASVQALPEQCRITPAELRAQLDSQASRPRLVDVREPEELEVCALEDARNIPLSRLDSALGGLDRDGHYVVFCRSGGRSARAVQRLREGGFGNVQSLEGGLLRWVAEVDSNLVLV